MNNTQAHQANPTNPLIATNLSSPAAAISDIMLTETERSSREITGFWQIANRCSEYLESHNERSIREQTIRVAAELMGRHVIPGDYGAAGFHPWLGSIEERVARIDAAWDALGRTPDIVDPICWFAKRAS